jgi:hypothetical protein
MVRSEAILKLDRNTVLALLLRVFCQYIQEVVNLNFQIGVWPGLPASGRVTQNRNRANQTVSVIAHNSELYLHVLIHHLFIQTQTIECNF